MISVPTKVESVKERKFNIGGGGGLSRFDAKMLERSSRVAKIYVRDEDGEILLFDKRPVGMGLVEEINDKFALIDAMVFYRENEKSLMATIQLPNMSVTSILFTANGSISIGGTWSNDLKSPWITGGLYYAPEMSEVANEGDVPEVVREARNVPVTWTNVMAFAEIARDAYPTSIEIDHAALGIEFNPSPPTLATAPKSEAKAEEAPNVEAPTETVEKPKAAAKGDKVTA